MKDVANERQRNAIARREQEDNKTTRGQDATFVDLLFDETLAMIRWSTRTWTKPVTPRVLDL